MLFAISIPAEDGKFMKPLRIAQWREHDQFIKSDEVFSKVENIGPVFYGANGEKAWGRHHAQNVDHCHWVYAVNILDSFCHGNVTRAMEMISTQFQIAAPGLLGMETPPENRGHPTPDEWQEFCTKVYMLEVAPFIPGGYWRHHRGGIYGVLDVYNESSGKAAFPIMIAYQSHKDGAKFSRPARDFFENFTPLYEG